MTCDRCHNEITLGQWADDWCPATFTKIEGPRHYVEQEQLREAFQRSQMEASYARHQP